VSLISFLVSGLEKVRVVMGASSAPSKHPDCLLGSYLHNTYLSFHAYARSMIRTGVRKDTTPNEDAAWRWQHVRSQDRHASAPSHDPQERRHVRLYNVLHRHAPIAGRSPRFLDVAQTRPGGPIWKPFFLCHPIPGWRLPAGFGCLLSEKRDQSTNEWAPAARFDAPSGQVWVLVPSP
jgi:hypothetical protein